MALAYQRKANLDFLQPAFIPHSCHDFQDAFVLKSQTLKIRSLKSKFAVWKYRNSLLKSPPFTTAPSSIRYFPSIYGGYIIMTHTRARRRQQPGLGHCTVYSCAIGARTVAALQFLKMTRVHAIHRVQSVIPQDFACLFSYVAFSHCLCSPMWPDPILCGTGTGCMRLAHLMVN